MSSYLPEEIIINILCRLQVKSIFRFKCVCKSWYKLLSSNNLNFVKMHLNHAVDEKNNKNCSLMINHSDDFYLIDSVSSSSSSELCYEAVKVDTPFDSRLVLGFSGCNGLICVATYSGSRFFIWNPSTKEYKEISRPPITGWYRLIAYGFGYDCMIDDYKLVIIVNLKVIVYTLGSSSWRNVQSVPPIPFFAKTRTGVLLNRALHWIELENIVSFDIGDERFQEIELPNCLVGTCTSNVGVLIGDLCVVDHLDHSHDVWVMKDYGVIESWTRLYTIAQDTSISSYFKLIHSFKNGEILLLDELNKENDNMNDTKRRDALVSYDPKHDRVRMLKIQGSPNIFKGIQTCVGSLVSPNRVLL